MNSPFIWDTQEEEFCLCTVVFHSGMDLWGKQLYEAVYIELANIRCLNYFLIDSIRLSHISNADVSPPHLGFRARAEIQHDSCDSHDHTSDNQWLNKEKGFFIEKNLQKCIKNGFKETAHILQFHPKMNIFSTFTRPHVVPDFLSSVENKRRFF